MASAAIMDSQSVKTTAIAGERGFDAAKNVTGRNRHLLVDVLGLLLTVVVSKASVPEREGRHQEATSAPSALEWRNHHRSQEALLRAE